MITKVYMVRHCESEGNACRRCHAQFDGITTKKGLKQAEALAKRFKDIPVTAIYSSDAYRSRVTAEPLAKEKKLSVQYRMLLREYTIGCWEGLGIGDAARKYPEMWDIWINTPYAHHIPGADPFNVIAERGCEIIRRMAAENPGGTVVAVTHSCTLTCALTSILGQDISYYKQVKSGDNTAVTLLEVSENGKIEPIFINDDSHLPQELRRNNYTGRGASSNFAFDYLKEETDFLDFEREYLQYLEEKGQTYSDANIREMFLKPFEDSNCSIAFPVLIDKKCGLIKTSYETQFPQDHGFLNLLYIHKEIRDKGFREQAFGEAIDFLRLKGKRYIVIDKRDTDFAPLVDRFCFEEVPEQANYLRLKITVPSVEGPIY